MCRKNLLHALLVIATVLVCGVILYSANALIDDNGKPTLTLEDNATPNTIIRAKGDATTGAVLVSGIGTSGATTFEVVNYDVPATSNSGTNLDPAADSTRVMISNDSIYDCMVNFNGTASSTVGLPLDAGEKLFMNDVSISGLSVYNEGAATASIAAGYWR